MEQVWTNNVHTLGGRKGDLKYEETRTHHDDKIVDNEAYGKNPDRGK